MTTPNPTDSGVTEGLKPCPFCGVIPAMQSHTQEDEMDNGRYLFFVECGNSQCPMGLVSTGGPYKSAGKAAERWNTRVGHDPIMPQAAAPTDNDAEHVCFTLNQERDVITCSRCGTRFWSDLTGTFRINHTCKGDR